MCNPFLTSMKKSIDAILSTPVIPMAGDTGQTSSMIKATSAMNHLARESDINWEAFVENLRAGDLKELICALERSTYE